VGNAASAPAKPSAPAFVYGRTHPTLEGYAREALAPHLFLVSGGSLTLNWLDVPADGKLATDMRSANPVVRALVGDARTHAVGILQQGLVWDSRDDELIPRRGMWHEVDLRMSPGLGDAMPYAYCELLAIGRGYVPIGDRFVLAGRVLGDALFGRPPIYQLAEYDDTYALGGSAGIRGVPAARYYGKAKLIANLEARTDVARLRFVNKPWAVAIVAFLDAGRLWADWSSNPDLDGTGLGLKWGTGFGVRVQQGKAFVVRGDLAWSPDALPIGAYFAAGETF
jgi:outer membrane protein assembly factor BamA